MQRLLPDEGIQSFASTSLYKTNFNFQSLSLLNGLSEITVLVLFLKSTKYLATYVSRIAISQTVHP